MVQVLSTTATPLSCLDLSYNFLSSTQLARLEQIIIQHIMGANDQRSGSSVIHHPSSTTDSITNPSSIINAASLISELRSNIHTNPPLKLSGEGRRREGKDVELEGITRTGPIAQPFNAGNGATMDSHESGAGQPSLDLSLNMDDEDDALLLAPAAVPDPKALFMKYRALLGGEGGDASLTSTDKMTQMVKVAHSAISGMDDG